MNTCLFRHRASTALALALAAAGAWAAPSSSMTSAEIYSKAEEWFQWLEQEQGYVTHDPVTLLDEGYYHRCYTNGECFGVSLTAQDGYTYKKEAGKDWVQVGNLEELLPQFTNLQVRILGKIQGDLADDLDYEVEPAEKGPARAKAPLILGEKNWTAADRMRIFSAFKADVPIVMLNATAEEVARLNKLLKLTKGFGVLPDGVSTLEVYAIDRDSRGDVHELKVLPPVELPQAFVEEYTGSDATGTVITTREEAAPFADSNPLQSIRTREAIQWIEEDAMRDAAAAARAAEGRAALAGDQFKNLEDVVRSYESRMVFNFRKNVHSLTTNVWSVHNATVNEDWFYVRQQGVFSAANELLPLAYVNNTGDKEGNDRGRFTDLYNINTYVDGFGGNSAVYLDQASPITTTGVTKITSSVSWNLSGKLSGNAKCGSDGKCEIGGGAEIAGGVTVNNSVSFDIPDVTVRNQSGTSLNNAAWDFAIAWPAWTSGFGCIGFWGLGPLASVSGATFQPTTQWIWRVGSAVRASKPAGLPIAVNFKTRVRHIYYGPACNWNMTNWSQESSGLTGSMVVPWPAKN